MPTWFSLLGVVLAAAGLSRAADVLVIPSLLANSTAVGPMQTRLGDVDGDGQLDAVSVGYNSGDALWFAGASGAPTEVGSGMVLPHDVALVDLDGDGDLDAVVTNFFVDELRLFENGGLGDFSLRRRYEDLAKPHSVLAADVDADGWPDLVVSGDEVGVMRGSNVSWEFGSLEAFALSGGKHWVGDVDGDGDVDVAVPLRAEGELQLFHNDGQGGFALYETVTGLDEAVCVGAGDFDSDGDVDFVLGQHVEGKLQFLQNTNGRGRLGTVTQIGTPDLDGANQFCVEDLDLDGDLDLAVAYFYNDGVWWYENLGGAFSGSQELFSTAGLEWTTHVSCGDVDGDGDVDMVTGGRLESELYYLEVQTVPFAPPNVTVEPIALNTARVTWLAAGDNGAAVTEYRVMRDDDVAYTGTDADVVVVINAEVGQEISVRAYNERGAGPLSDPWPYARDCVDGVQGELEAGVDCGGWCREFAFVLCDDGQTCDIDDDCNSGVCSEEDGGVCVSCADGVQNQDESDVDCGGVCGSTCADGETCDSADDCINGVCSEEDGDVCVSCMDGVLNQDETDFDCGGDACGATCTNGDDCEVDGDCRSDTCLAEIGRCVILCSDDAECAVGECDEELGRCISCEDSTQNQDETDFDCGGVCGATCGPGDSCHLDGDCSNDDCVDGAYCATCVDALLNQDETDLDCGGSLCSPCNLTQSCALPRDCYSTWCGYTGECEEPDVPDAVDDLAAWSADSTVGLAWSAPRDNGRNVTSYTVVEARGQLANHTVANGTTEWQLGGLVNGNTSLSFFVVPVNELGEGPPSDTVWDVTPYAELAFVTLELERTVGWTSEFRVVASSAPRSSVRITPQPAEVSTSVAPASVWLHPNDTEAVFNVTFGLAGCVGIEFDLAGSSSYEFRAPDTLILATECAEGRTGEECDGCLPGYFALDGECEACPAFAECAGDTAVPEAVAGFWTGSPGVVSECVPAAACPGGYDACAAGYEGERCAECEGFRLSGECVACPPAAMVWPCVALGVLGALVAALYHLCRHHEGAVDSVDIALDFFQRVSLLAPYEFWPPVVRNTLSVFSAARLNVELLALDCLGVSFEARWAGTVFGLPLLALALPLLLPDRRAAEHVRRVLLQVVFLGVMVAALSAVDCRTLEPRGEEILEVDPQRACVTPLMAPGIIASAVYSVAFPAYFAFQIRKRNGVVFPRFADTHQWWGFSVMFRKLGLALAMVVLSGNPPFQLAVMSLMIAFAWVAQAENRPYRSAFNALEDTQMACTLAVVLAGSVFSAAGFTEDDWQHLAMTIGTMTILVLCAAVVVEAVCLQVGVVMWPSSAAKTAVEKWWPAVAAASSDDSESGSESGSSASESDDVAEDEAKPSPRKRPSMLMRGESVKTLLTAGPTGLFAEYAGISDDVSPTKRSHSHSHSHHRGSPAGRGSPAARRRRWSCRARRRRRPPTASWSR